MNNIKYIGLKLKEKLIPTWFKNIIEPDFGLVNKRIKEFSKTLKPGSSILDAGAGHSPYKKYFSHCNYVAADFVEHDKKGDNFQINIICDLEKLPFKNNTFDAIINTWVIEHIPNPEKMLNELKRVLKPNGKIFIAIPQGYMIHQEPYNFFYFTEYGIKILLEKTKLRLNYMERIGVISG